MDSVEFINNVKSAVENPAVNTILKVLVNPGKSPTPEQVALASWWAGLCETDKVRVREVIRQVSQHTIYNFLCVFDGLSSIQRLPHSGRLELTFKSNDGQTLLLNNPKSEELHAIYRALCD